MHYFLMDSFPIFLGSLQLVHLLISIGLDWAFQKMKSNFDIKLSAVRQSSQFANRTVKEWNSLSYDHQNLKGETVPQSLLRISTNFQVQIE